MAQETKKIDYKNAYLSLEEGKIYEYKKEDILPHDLVKLLNEYLPDENSRINISISASNEVLGDE